MLQEKNITTIQCDGQHLKMKTKTKIVTQIFFLNRIIHFQRSNKISLPRMIRAPILIPSPMTTLKAMGISLGLNHSRIPFGSQGNNISDMGVSMLDKQAVFLFFVCLYSIVILVMNSDRRTMLFFWILNPLLFCWVSSNPCKKNVNVFIFLSSYKSF